MVLNNLVRKFWDEKFLVLILVLSVVARVAAAFWMGDQVVNLPGTADQLSYHTIAQQLLSGKGFTFPQDWWPATPAGQPTAHWSYLYSFYITLVYAIFGVHPLAARLIQAVVVGILHPWLIYKIGSSQFGKTAGIWAALITAIYIYFIYYSAALMTEPFYITAILASLLAAILLVQKNRPLVDFRSKLSEALLLGLFLGIAILFRQLFLLVVPFLFLWILWLGGRKKISSLLLAGIVVVVMILPFTIFNYARFNRFVLVNTNAGFAFFWGNHPSYGSKFIPILPSEAYLAMIPRDMLNLDEAALDQALLKKAVGFILDDPARYIRLSISRIPAYFMFWPSSESGLVSNLSRVGSFGVFLPFMLTGIVLSFRKTETANRPDEYGRIQVLILGFAVIYTGIHLLTWALIRYRLPVDAVLLLYAGLTFSRIPVWMGRK